MANKVILSKFGSLNLSDANKGVIVAALTALLYVVQELIPGWNIGPQAKAAISALVGYLLKNYLSPAAVITTYSSNDEAASVAADINPK
jgi:hypothetical protein